MAEWLCMQVFMGGKGGNNPPPPEMSIQTGQS